jgi:hypothetical protein
MIPAEGEWAASLSTHLVVQRNDNMWIMKRATHVVADQLGAPQVRLTLDNGQMVDRRRPTKSWAAVPGLCDKEVKLGSHLSL